MEKMGNTAKLFETEYDFICHGQIDLYLSGIMLPQSFPTVYDMPILSNKGMSHTVDSCKPLLFG